MAETTNAVVQSTQNMVPKKKSIAIIACLLGGALGIHKFYEGKIFMGLLYLVSCGLFGIGVIVDLIKLIGKPSVYYVEKKNYGIDLDKIKDSVMNFPLDKVGKVVSGIGGAVIGIGGSMEFNLPVMLAGLAIAGVGIVLTWLKVGDFKDVLISNGIITGVLAVGMFALALLIAAVIVYIAVKLLLGIDLIEWLSDLFGDGKNKQQDTDLSSPSPYAKFPEFIYDEQGNQYRLQHNSGDHADYYCPSTGDRRQIWADDLET